jgi:hypothetical protein
MGSEQCNEYEQRRDVRQLVHYENSAKAMKLERVPNRPLLSHPISKCERGNNSKILPESFRKVSLPTIYMYVLVVAHSTERYQNLWPLTFAVSIGSIPASKRHMTLMNPKNNLSDAFISEVVCHGSQDPQVCLPAILILSESIVTSSYTAHDLAYILGIEN